MFPWFLNYFSHFIKRWNILNIFNWHIDYLISLFIFLIAFSPGTWQSWTASGWVSSATRAINELIVGTFKSNLWLWYILIPNFWLSTWTFSICGINISKYFSIFLNILLSLFVFGALIFIRNKFIIQNFLLGQNLCYRPDIEPTIWLAWFLWIWWNNLIDFLQSCRTYGIGWIIIWIRLIEVLIFIWNLLVNIVNSVIRGNEIFLDG